MYLSLSSLLLRTLCLLICVYCFFSQTLDRNVSSINDGDDSVTYTQIRKLSFNAEKSGPLKLTDKVVTANPALIVSQLLCLLHIKTIPTCLKQMEYEMEIS